MKGLLAVGFAALVALLVPPAGGGQAAEEREVTGRVVDAGGEPAAGIEVATYWLAEEGRWGARRSAVTDEEGAFALPVSVASRSRSLMALDETQERGAVVLLDEESAAEPLLLRLAPTTEVRGAFESEGLGQPPEKVHVSVTATPAVIAVALHSGEPSFALRLPPGDYRLTVKGVDCVRARKRIVLTEDMRAVDLGTTDLEPTVIARHYGREPPPWNVTDARGVQAPAQPSDFRGKWVLLEFWGHW